MIKEIEKLEGKNYEVKHYYPKVNGRYTSKTGNVSKVIQCDTAEELALYLASMCWGRTFEDSDVALPTVYKDGKEFGRFLHVE